MTLTNNQTRKLVTLGVLSALGAVLMILEIPYPFAAFLTFELSEVVVLVVFVLFGWKEAAAVGALKALVHLLFKGPVTGGIAIPIGQITAFIVSMSYVLALYVTLIRFKMNKYVGAMVSMLIVTFILTVLNYFIITPIWFGTWDYRDLLVWVSPAVFEVNFAGGYLTTILIVYVPYNLLKGALIVSAFYIVQNVLSEYLNVNNE